jgi:hypothetical protein
VPARTGVEAGHGHARALMRRSRSGPKARPGRGARQRRHEGDQDRQPGPPAMSGRATEQGWDPPTAPDDRVTGKPSGAQTDALPRGSSGVLIPTGRPLGSRRGHVANRKGLGSASSPSSPLPRRSLVEPRISADSPTLSPSSGVMKGGLEVAPSADERKGP